MPSFMDERIERYFFFAAMTGNLLFYSDCAMFDDVIQRYYIFGQNPSSIHHLLPQPEQSYDRCSGFNIQWQVVTVIRG